jgi:uncharacterized protein YwqG
MPKDATGQPMVMVFQINFEEPFALPGFPEAGLLQLFLSTDVTERGITFFREHLPDDGFPLRNGDGFRLVFRPDTGNLSEKANQVPDDEYPICTPEFASQPRAMIFDDLSDHQSPLENWRGLQVYKNFERLPEAQGFPYELEDLLASEVWDEQLQISSYLGGFACPRQLDQRSFFEEYQRYDTCIMNFGSLPGLDLADMNLAVLIAESDLRKAQFDDTLMIADSD